MPTFVVVLQTTCATIRSKKLCSSKVHLHVSSRQRHTTSSCNAHCTSSNRMCRYTSLNVKIPPHTLSLFGCRISKSWSIICQTNGSQKQKWRLFESKWQLLRTKGMLRLARARVHKSKIQRHPMGRCTNRLPLIRRSSNGSDRAPNMMLGVSSKGTGSSRPLPSSNLGFQPDVRFYIEQIPATQKSSLSSRSLFLRGNRTKTIASSLGPSGSPYLPPEGGGVRPR